MGPNERPLGVLWIGSRGKQQKAAEVTLVQLVGLAFQWAKQ